MLTPDPPYWLREQTGTLRPVILAYLHGEPMTAREIDQMREYLRLWIMHPSWLGADDLRRRAGGLNSREAIAAWLSDAQGLGIDPL